MVIHRIFTAERLENFHLGSFCLHLKDFQRVYHTQNRVVLFFLDEGGNSLRHKVEVIDFVTLAVNSLGWRRQPRLHHRGDPSHEVAVSQVLKERELVERRIVHDHHELHLDTVGQVMIQLFKVAISFVSVEVQSISNVLDELLGHGVHSPKLVQL